VFHPEFREDLKYWVQTDRKVALRAFELIEAILREPFYRNRQTGGTEVSRGRSLVATAHTGAQSRVPGVGREDRFPPMQIPLLRETIWYSEATRLVES
jgi:hypothetical protein